MTTLENMSQSYPTPLLSPISASWPKSTWDSSDGPGLARSDSAGAATATPSTPSIWRSTHILDRSERVQLRGAARGLNIYDLGWKRNILSVLAPDLSFNRHRLGKRRRLKSLLLVLWPLTDPPAGGDEFEYDDNTLEKLKNLTRKLRLSDEAAEAQEGMWEDDA